MLSFYSRTNNWRAKQIHYCDMCRITNSITIHFVFNVITKNGLNHTGCNLVFDYKNAIIPYTYKFSRGVIFVDLWLFGFPQNVCPQK